ncbi:hypothetical protein ACFL27_15695, partial [candidate division CSSED10-310 bacterium]
MAISSLIYLIFFFSGMSGLMYQVVWVREFGQIFGNNIYSASLVTSVFMLGLGVGSFLAGKFADRKYHDQPGSGLKFYAYFEFGIACLGLVIALILPHLEFLSATISAYELGDQGWFHLSLSSYLFRYGVAVILLIPITLLMGGTLTLLIRFLVRTELSLAGWHIGLLYGLNTAGAAGGCFLVDFYAIPQLGLFSTQLLAVFLNLFASIGAFFILHRLDLSDQVKSPPAIVSGAVDQIKNKKALLLLLAAIFMSGFAAMGLEILWFRYLTSALGQYRIVFSLLLFVILLGIWLGSVVAGFISRRVERPGLLYMVSQLAFVIVSSATFLYFDERYLFSSETVRQYLINHGPFTNFSEYRLILRSVVYLVGLPSFFM